MRNPFGRAVHIGVSQTGVAVLRTAWRRKPVLLGESPLIETTVTPEQLTSQLRAILAESTCSGMSASIVLSDAWARLFIVTPPHNTVWRRDCQAAAEMRFQTLYGDRSDDWRLEANWDARHPFLACAIPNGLLDALREVAWENGLQLISVAPHYIAAWNRWRKGLHAGAWFGALNDNSLTLGMIERGRLVGVRLIAIPAHACEDPHWLRTHLAREALKMNLSVPNHVQLCGRAPEQWLTRTPGTLQCSRLDMQGDSGSDKLSSEAALAWMGGRQ